MQTGALLLLLASLPAFADGLILRGNYWRDRNTRVVAPEAEFDKELPTGTRISGGYLLDAITSASVAAGVLSDQPFTELRNQIGLRLGQRIGPVTLTGNYRYSTESDYWAHTGGGTMAADLFEKNLALAASLFYSHAEVARRGGPTGYIPVGHLNSWIGIFSVSPVLSRWATANLSLELSRLGDANDHATYQANPYRTVVVSGTPQRELEPLERNRLALSGELRIAVPGPLGLLRHLVFHARYRYYRDDWGIAAHAPELRTYTGWGPFELRFTGRYFAQGAASFYPRDPDGVPMLIPTYPAGGISFRERDDPNHCLCYTGDAKLSQFESMFFELRLLVPLRFLDHPVLPLGHWLSDGSLALSYGHYFTTRSAHLQYGDAEVGSLEWVLPL